jgi:hypothetical protein
MTMTEADRLLFAQAQAAFAIMTTDEQIDVLAHFASHMHAALSMLGQDANLQVAFVNAVHRVITKATAQARRTAREAAQRIIT